MGLVNGSLQIGRSALLANQALMQIIGNNIANAGNPDYTRQTGKLAPVPGNRLLEGVDPGSGVKLVGLQRSIDRSIEQRLRESISDNNYDDLTTQVLSRLEVVFNELSENDISTSLNEFFNAFSELQSKPQDISQRSIVVQTAQSLTEKFHSLRYDVLGVYKDLSVKMEDIVEQINRITGQIADLNAQIAYATSSGGNAGAILDERDRQLKELAELVNIHVIEQDAGVVTVYIGSEPVVQYNQARELEVKEDSDGTLIIPKLIFKDTGQEIEGYSGQAGAVIDLVQEYVSQYLYDLDDLASAIIFEVNKLHSSGQGLSGFSSTTSSNAVEDSTQPLNDADLPFTPINGTFLITVTDKNTSQSQVYQINVDLDGIGTDTSLDDLASQIDAIDNISAQVLPDGKLQIQVDSDNYEFTFSEDSSYVLAALGINGFFVGRNAYDIEVNPEIVNDVNLLACAQNGQPGDGSNAEAIANLRSTGVDSLGGISIMDQYREIVGRLGTQTAGAKQRHQVHQAMVDTLTAQRESISGVNIDEETVNLMTAQSAFQGAARYISAVNEMIQDILSIL